MDNDGMRDYLNSPFGVALLEHLATHCRRADQEVLRQAQATEYDPLDVRFRAGVTTGMRLIMDAIRQLRKSPDAS